MSKFLVGHRGRTQRRTYSAVTISDDMPYDLALPVAQDDLAYRLNVRNDTKFEVIETEDMLQAIEFYKQKVFVVDDRRVPVKVNSKLIGVSHKTLRKKSSAVSSPSKIIPSLSEDELKDLLS